MDQHDKNQKRTSRLLTPKKIPTYYDDDDDDNDDDDDRLHGHFRSSVCPSKQ
jgi:hypothetical protein